jgi:hypothetical protein
MTPHSYSLEVQIAEVQAEIATRQKVYGRLVVTGKMKPSQAEYKIAVMAAVLATLEELLAERGP